MANKRPTIKCTCSFCNRVVEYKCGKGQPIRKFCSQSCHFAWKRGKTIEEILGNERGIEFKENLRKISVGENNPNFGNTWSEEQRLLASEKSLNRFECQDMRWLAGSANRGVKFSNERIFAMHGHRTTESYSHPKTEETKRKIGEKSKDKFNNLGYRINFRKTMEKAGHWTPLEELDEYSLYRKLSNWVSGMWNIVPSYGLLEEFKVYNSYTNTKGVVRDHIYSRKSGWINLVFPEILRHPENCQIITHSDNVKKKTDRYTDLDLHSLEELFDKIIHTKYDWREQQICLLKIQEYNIGKRYNPIDYFYERRGGNV